MPISGLPHSSAVAPASPNSDEFDSLQAFAALNYAGGDFDHISTVSAADNCGDTLFTFVIRELADARGDFQEASRMISNAACELQELSDQMVQFHLKKQRQS